MIMEEVKNRLTQAVADKLAAAPESTAKAELVEELADNLYHRYLDLIAAGTDQAAAWSQALDNLGDVEELVEYLNSLKPDEPLPELVLRPDQGDSGQLDELLKNVEEIVKGALSKAKSALKGAKDVAEDNLGITADDVLREAKGKVSQALRKGRESLRQAGGAWRGEDGHEEAHVSEYDDNHGEHPYGEGRQEEKDDSRSWRFTAGYDRGKGGFYAQWEGPNAGAPVPLDGPIHGQALTGLAVRVSGDVTIRLTEAEDGDVVIGGDVERLEAFRTEDGILTIQQNSRTASSAFFFRRGLSPADVRLSLPRRYWDFLRVDTASGDVELSGDVPLGTVAVKTASGDLDGRLPHCERLTFQSSSGDLEWEGGAGQIQAETVSGDLIFRGRLSQVGRLQCKSVSGDIEWEGTVQEARIQTVSGDVALRGMVQNLRVSTVSGDVETDGSLSLEGWCDTVSGAIRLGTAFLPQRLEITTKSGDCQLQLPDEAPFALTFKTTGGRLRSAFFAGEMGGGSNTFTYRGKNPAAAGDNCPHYQVSCTSGDLSLYKY